MTKPHCFGWQRNAFDTPLAVIKRRERGARQRANCFYQLFQGRLAGAQFSYFFLANLRGASRDNSSSAVGNQMPLFHIRDCERDISQGSKHSKADRDIRLSIESDLLECRIHQPFEAKPGNGGAE